MVLVGGVNAWFWSVASRHLAGDMPAREGGHRWLVRIALWTWWFTEGLTLVRREVQRRDDPDQRPPTSEPDLFQACLTLLRRPDHLTHVHQEHDLDLANKTLRRLADLYATGQIPEYHEVVDTIIASKEGILAYQPSRRATNGPLEPIQQPPPRFLRRVAHGLTNYDNYAARGMLVT